MPLSCEAKQKITAAVALAAGYLRIIIAEIKEQATYAAAGTTGRYYEEEWARAKSLIQTFRRGSISLAIEPLENL